MSDITQNSQLNFKAKQRKRWNDLSED